jgi:MEMO1 family protein
MDNIRPSKFSDKFYPGNKELLINLIEKVVHLEKKKMDTLLNPNVIFGGVVPHAGYIFSAYQAVHFFEQVKRNGSPFDTLVIINPNHTGMGSGDLNTSSYHLWETPLGSIPIDSEFQDRLGIVSNNKAHEEEHSGEVILPLAQFFFNFPFKLVVITMNRQNPDVAYTLAGKINETSKALNKKALIISSSDFSHYETPDAGFTKDQFLLDAIVNMDAEKAFFEVRKHNITSCGFGPIMSLIYYARMVSEKPRMKILSRGHSGEIMPSEQVVDYVSLLCFDE